MQQVTNLVSLPSFDGSVRTIFTWSLTQCNTSALFRRSLQMIFILLQRHISKFPRRFWSTDRSVHCYENSQKSDAKHTSAKRLSPFEISQRPHPTPHSQQDRKCTHKHNIKVRSRNRCCCGKAIRI